jgi:hypothetical protein
MIPSWQTKSAVAWASDLTLRAVAAQPAEYGIRMTDLAVWRLFEHKRDMAAKSRRASMSKTDPKSPGGVHSASLRPKGEDDVIARHRGPRRNDRREPGPGRIAWWQAPDNFLRAWRSCPEARSCLDDLTGTEFVR